ncbi:MAG: adhesin HecA-like repeat protein [Paracoccaceae bacterium]|jgi:adhesin HecA-like repeat protein
MEQMTLYPDWEFVADRVMGGLSRGAISHELVHGQSAVVLRGDVSLDNNGGFIQIAFDLSLDGTALDASDWEGLEIDVCGNGERYDIRLRTDDLTRPWKSFRTDFATTPEWRTIKIPFAEFVAHKTDAIFDPAKLRRIGILAIGHAFQAEVAIANIRLYRPERAAIQA